MERPTASFPRPLGLEPCPASRPRARPCLWGCPTCLWGLCALAACGPSGLPSPLLALPQVAPWEGKGRASVWPAAKPTAPLRTEITSNIRRWDPSSDLSQCQYILRIEAMGRSLQCYELHGYDKQSGFCNKNGWVGQYSANHPDNLDEQSSGKVQNNNYI